MDRRHIVPVEPASGNGEVVVVEVLQDGPQPLDVRLVACEGESPFVKKLRQRDVGKLKRKFKGSDEDWQAVLAYFLLQQQPDEARRGLLDHVRIVHTLKGDSVEISIRQHVEGIKVTLGELSIPRDDGFEFNPFEWAQASAQSHLRTRQELAELRDRAGAEQATIAKLKAQLDDFITAKKETEDQMLQQMMQLLNDKKRKIRDQNRLLAVADVDKATASTIKTSRDDTTHRRADASRRSKRKAASEVAEAEVPPAPPSDDEMELDRAPDQEQDDSSGAEAVTSEASVDETEDEDESSSAGQAQGRGQPAASASQTSVQSSRDAKPPTPPAPRPLPFHRQTRSTPAARPSAPAVDEEEDTEDEEL